MRLNDYLDFAALALEFAGIDQDSDTYEQWRANKVARAAEAVLSEAATTRHPVNKAAHALVLQIELLAFYAKSRDVISETKTAVRASAEELIALVRAELRRGVG